MKTVFADACYWVALLNPRDNLHSIALSVSASLASCRLVTSEFVLIETLKLMAGAGAQMKNLAYEMMVDLHEHPDVELVPATSFLFRQACEIYIRYADKAWDVVDCTSYRIMQERGIEEALTYDRHFEQMGFKALLRR